MLFGGSEEGGDYELSGCWKMGYGVLYMGQRCFVGEGQLIENSADSPAATSAWESLAHQDVPLNFGRFLLQAFIESPFKLDMRVTNEELTTS